jgi:hypothetical protein
MTALMMACVTIGTPLGAFGLFDQQKHLER